MVKNPIKDWRTKHGLTLTAAAKKLGAYDSGVISKWESGKRIPRKQTLKRIARVLEMPPMELIEALYDPRLGSLARELVGTRKD